MPEIVFQSTKIRKTEAGYVVDGTLEMHGRKQTIAVPLRVTGEFTRNGRTSTGLADTLTLKRSDYGINWKHQLPEFVGDEVIVYLRLLMKPAQRK